MFSFGKPKAEQQVLEKALSKSLNKKVKLSFSGDGVRRILIEPKGKVTHIRLDPLFENIEGKAYDSLVQFILKGDEHSKSEIIEFLRHQKERAPDTIEVHPFQLTLNQLQAQHFPRLPELKLVRGKEGKKGGQKSIRLASYWAERREIRLHPYLEEEGVPDYYIQYLLFHELCHAQLVMSGQAKDGEHHGPDFIALEKKFPMIDKANHWEKESLNAFLETCKNSRAAL